MKLMLHFLASGAILVVASFAAETKGYVITTRDGRKAFIWYTDQMGGTAMTRFDQVETALKASGTTIKEEPLKLKGVFPPFA
jgi:hypothetical protein